MHGALLFGLRARISVAYSTHLGENGCVRLPSGWRALFLVAGFASAGSMAVQKFSQGLGTDSAITFQLAPLAERYIADQITRHPGVD